jgi:3-hydroxybutyryl-CoA dehydrogenase
MYKKMQILILGCPQIEAEFRQKFAGSHDLVFLPGYQQLQQYLETTQVVFDFLLASYPDYLRVYQGHPALVVFCNTVLTTLASLLQQRGQLPDFTLLGFNGWPGMVDRQYLEVSVWTDQDQGRLSQACQNLGTAYLRVDDRVGLVTPRVLGMMINEAFYTCQDGTATAADIDLAMKLGTNYPFGPFEWSNRIGLAQVYQLLEAVYADTQDERYKICPMLKKEYLKQGFA